MKGSWCSRIQFEEECYEASRDIWSVAGGQVMPCYKAGQAELELGS